MLTLLRQIVAARSFHRSSHRPTQVLTGQAELAVGEAEEARPRGHAGLMGPTDGLAVNLRGETRQLLIVICHRQDLTQSC